MKKLFTLLALLAIFLGAKAKTVVDAEVKFSDYTDISEWDFKGGWGSASAKARLSIVDGCLHFESTEATDPDWDCQFTPIAGFTSELETTYTLHFKIKGDHTGNVSMLGFGQTPYGQFQITDQWVEGTVNYDCTDASSTSILMQCGGWIGTWDIAYLKITHEQDESTPTQTWLQMLTDTGNPPAPEGDGKYVGDAEFGAWPAWSLELTDGINANWRGDRTGEICAWALTMGKNFDDQNTVISEDSPRSRPYPADIELEEGTTNHVFAVHVDQVAVIDADASIAWSNQFWIQSPQEWKQGTKVKIHFRYKADRAQRTETQIHKIHPSDYLFWNAVGDVKFTTEWQDFDRTIELSSDQAGGTSLAFNLTPDAANDDNGNPKDAASLEPNVFYFDDLSWEVLKLEHGFFVAGKGASVAYDYGKAIEFEYDADEEAYIATIGTVGDKDSWVDEVQISTVRGDKSAFLGATLKPTTIILDSYGISDWLNYTETSQAKIKLPAAGVYRIGIDPVLKQMQFEQLEGDVPVVKEAVDIVMNTTEVTVKGKERQPTSAEQPADAEAGTPAGTGQTYDNQFFLVANRTLAAGEKTHVSFEYKRSNYEGTADVTSGTQCHNGPGQYIHYAAIGSFTFTEEWQKFDADFTIPAQCDGSDSGNGYMKDFKSIAFNMAEVKDACDYELKNFKWYLVSDDDEEGKTYENLINAEGTANFLVKEGAGTTPYEYGTDPAGIQNVTSKAKIGSAALYNLAGQRVANDYKGIVVKDGKKFVNK